MQLNNRLFIVELKELSALTKYLEDQSLPTEGPHLYSMHTVYLNITAAPEQITALTLKFTSLKALAQ